jgi:hypothetical protein
MLAVLVGVCLASTAFFIRFLIALRVERKRLLVCHVVRLRTESEVFAIPRPRVGIHVRAHAA